MTEKLSKQIQALDAELSDPDMRENAAWKVAQLSKKRADRASELKRTEEEWLSLSAQYEAAVTAG